MELDRELEQRVWQRVCHQPEIPDREGELARLISRRLGLAAEYARLSRQPSHRTAFARLEKTARKQAMCLMGLYRLGGADAKISPLPPAYPPDRIWILFPQSIPSVLSAAAVTAW